jgi:hypothetical protein
MRTLARSLQSMGHRISHQLVRELLSAAGYSLQANRKTREGPPDPNRDAQFRHIAALPPPHGPSGSRRLEQHDPSRPADETSSTYCLTSPYWAKRRAKTAKVAKAR